MGGRKRTSIFIDSKYHEKLRSNSLDKVCSLVNVLVLYLQFKNDWLHRGIDNLENNERVYDSVVLVNNLWQYCLVWVMVDASMMIGAMEMEESHKEIFGMEERREESILELPLSENEEWYLEELVETLNKSIGVEVSPSWVIRTLIRLTARAHDIAKFSLGEEMVLLEMHGAIEYSGVALKYRLLEEALKRHYNMAPGIDGEQVR